MKRKKQIDFVILAGCEMSNVLFNLKQLLKNKIEDRHLKSMDETQKRWDEAVARLRS